MTELTPTRTPRYQRVIFEHPSVDWLAAAIAAVLVVGCQRSVTLLTAPDAATRRALYQTVATLSGSLFGLTVAIIGLMVANLSRPLVGLPNGLPPAVGKPIYRSLFALACALGLTVLTALVLLVGDGAAAGRNPNSAWLVTAAITLCVARLARVMYWLAKVVATST